MKHARLVNEEFCLTVHQYDRLIEYETDLRYIPLDIYQPLYLSAL